MTSACQVYGIFLNRENYYKVLSKFSEALTFEQKAILFLGWDPKKDIEANILGGDDREDDFERLQEDNYENNPDFMVNFFGETSFFDFIDKFQKNYPGLSAVVFENNQSAFICLSSGTREFEFPVPENIPDLVDLNSEEKIQLNKFVQDFDLEVEAKSRFYTKYFV